MQVYRGMMSVVGGKVEYWYDQLERLVGGVEMI